MRPLLPDFVPAKPNTWFVNAAQAMARGMLSLNNRLHVAEQDLNLLRKLPINAGIILASNHADETDPLVCLELSRRSKKRFFPMCNREAFDEMFGLAGLVLQRIGYFSVKRGSHNSAAKDYAIRTVQRGNDVLMIFPEGEIYYLNDVVQPFHSGAIEICMQAIVENRKVDSNWTAFILPMVIKYRYEPSVEYAIEKRIRAMEAHLMLKAAGDTLQSRLIAIQQLLLDREKRAHALAQTQRQLKFTQQIISTESAILSEIEQKHQDLKVSPHAAPIDQAWQLEAEIREEMLNNKNKQNKLELEEDLHALEEVAQLASWKPSYYSESKSFDRLAEAVLKAERELYQIKRPRQLAKRKVEVKFAEPLDMGQYAAAYLQDSRSVRHDLTNKLQEQIQMLLSSFPV